MPDEELLLLDEPQLRVTTARVMTTHATYPTDHITDVRVVPTKDTTVEQKGVYGLLVLGGKCLFWGYLLRGCADAADVRSVGWLVLVLALGVFTYAHMRSPAHTVYLCAYGQWVPVFVSMNKARSQKVFEVVERAVRRTDDAR